VKPRRLLLREALPDDVPSFGILSFCPPSRATPVTQRHIYPTPKSCCHSKTPLKLCVSNSSRVWLYIAASLEVYPLVGVIRRTPTHWHVGDKHTLGTICNSRQNTLAASNLTSTECTDFPTGIGVGIDQDEHSGLIPGKLRPPCFRMLRRSCKDQLAAT
jgi:hypothetical protein